MSLLDAQFAKRPLDEWTERFDAADLWWAPVNSPAELVQDPQAEAAGAFVDVPNADGSGTRRAVASPIRFSAADVSPRAGVPEVGQHTEQVLAEAGLDAERISRLRASGATGVAKGS
jgi:crotonobetainyl-CoA:carnitine CoA-transferase CaiB-like acyl-CoA transferase